MIDHVALYVSDLDRSRSFYEQALEWLDYAVATEGDGLVGFAHSDSLEFVLRSGSGPTTTAHVAFRADNRSAVDDFHAAAMSAGGTDQGAPGFASITTPPITRPSSPILTGTTSRPSVTNPPRSSPLFGKRSVSLCGRRPGLGRRDAAL
jgi:catechol 2,3-dioxygenase-like lactoylglutathione lyase family enzyme